MAGHSQPAAGAGADRRAFKRLLTSLPAVCGTEGAAERQCTIRDFCLGGLALDFGNTQAPPYPPAPGTLVEIRCTVKTSGGQKTLRFQGKVRHVDETAAGIAFQNPDLAALQTLLDFAASRPAPRAAAVEPPRTAGGTRGVRHQDAKSTQEILDGCRKILERPLDALITACLRKIVDHLFSSARDTRNVTEQNANLDAQAIFERSSDTLKLNFKKFFTEHLDFAPLQPRTDTRGPDKLSASSLSLVDDDVFEDWLAANDMISHIEARSQEPLTEIEQRLSHVLNVAINKENNPVGPVIYVNAFQQTLKDLQLPHLISQLSYKIFKVLLAGTLEGVYVKLNKFLIESGVLPEIEYSFTPAKGRKSPKHPATPSGKPAPKRGDDAGPQADATTAPAECSHESAPTQSDSLSELSAKDRATATLGEPGTQTARTQSERPAQDIYDIVQELKKLKLQVSGGTPPSVLIDGADGTGSRAGPEGVSPPYYSQNEVLTALSALQATSTALPPATMDSRDFRTQVLQILSDHDPLGEAPGKQLDSREGRIMDVAWNMFSSMLTDALVASSVRSWIDKLEIPLLKLALVDESLFLDKSHVARQVVNKIAQLDAYGGANSSNERTALRKTIDGILSRIANEHHVSTDIFQKAHNQIDRLVKLQNVAYEQNVKDVVAECEARERELRSADGIAAAQAEQSDEEKEIAEVFADANEHQEWLRRVRRLRLGSWILLDADSEHPQRLRLAWVSKEQNQFVFVNQLGLREAEFSINALALKLHNGAAAILEGAEEPVMDRAQYTMLQNLHQQLLHETTHDQLTGLINRVEFERRLRTTLSETEDKGIQHSVCHLDLVQFNVVNDTLGYTAGDRLLKEMADLLASEAGDDATVARIGGDEFAMLFTGKPVEDVERIVHNQIGAIKGFRVLNGDQFLSVSACVGIVSVDADSVNATDILRAAESACRTARQKGPNHIEVFSSHGEALAQRQKVLHWVTLIDQGLNRNRLDLRCQRIVAINEQEAQAPHHSEVLLSVTDEQGQCVSPAEFVLAAEHYHRISAVDRWVITTMFRWIKEHESHMDRFGGFAINLSGRSINEDTFLDFVLQEMENTGVPMHRVCFEITETAGVTNLSNAAEFILKLKETGCKFSLDDFGSGMSSYAYLKNLPVDYLKIDGAFVKDMHNNPNDYAVVKSITEIGHFMGKKIVAEYVENETILEQLRQIGVDYAQGFAIEEPHMLAELEAALVENPPADQAHSPSTSPEAAPYATQPVDPDPAGEIH